MTQARLSSLGKGFVIEDDRSIKEILSGPDLRSYLVCKYGHEYAEKAMKVLDKCGLCRLPDDKCECVENPYKGSSI